MRKAYLITAYDQPGYFGRLVRALQTDWAHFFVHIDGNVDIRPFTTAVEGLPHITFIRSRSITWMGFSQVESTLALLEEASKHCFDFYTLLSGSDYPIKSNSQIEKHFAGTNKEFITFWKLEDRPSWMHKIEYFYPTDWVPIMDYQEASFRRYFWGYFYKLMHHVPKRRYLKDMVPYGGSHWWSLTHDCVMFILDFARRNKPFVRFYRYSHSPSEMFFQTIILNSPFASRAQNYEQYIEWSKKTSRGDKTNERCMLPEDSFNFRYMDWSYERTGGKGRPATLDERDFEAIRSSDDLFARKFDEKLSATLLDLIDRELLKSA